MWIRALQDALAVPATGLPTRSLAQAIAALEARAGRATTGEVDPNFEWLSTKFPALADIPRQLGPDSEGAANARGREVGCAEDVGLRKAKVNATYKDYCAGILQRTSFVGKPVVGHPLFLSRLKSAEAWLSARKGGLNGGALADALGIHEVESFRPNTKDADQLMHGIGFAIDINKSANNWNFGNGAQAGRFAEIMTAAGELLGTTVIVGARALHAAPKDRTTEELFDHVSASNDALKRYRALCEDPAALDQHLASEGCPASAKKRSAAQWRKLYAGQKARLQARTAKTEEGAPPSGFMDFDSATIAGMRDAGGLRWGGVDFGEKFSGDMMHFDSYGTCAKAKTIRLAVQDARKLAGEPFK